MTKKEKLENCPVSDVLQKLEQLDLKIEEVVTKLGHLKKTFKSIQEDPEEEICPDEVAADAAVREIVQDICIEALLDVKPKGDA